MRHIAARPARLIRMEVYEFIIGRSLFRYEVNGELNLTETENVLYQMACYTGDDFRAEQLNVWPLAADYGM